MDPAFTIEPATTAVANDVLRLIELLYADESIPFRGREMSAALERLLTEPALGFILIARDRASRAVVAYGVATLGYDVEFAGADSFITDLYVDRRVRNRGIGQALLDALTQALAERGVKAVHLMVRPENQRAQALYQARGFNPVPRVLMTKLLGRDSS